MKVKSVYGADLAGKIVLVRVDFNVPMSEGVIRDNSRILDSVSHLKYLLEKEAKKVVIITHLGRPLGNVVEELRLKPVVAELESLLGEEVDYLQTDFDQLNRAMIEKSHSRIICLENIRFDRREEDGQEAFAKHLAGLGDVFVLEGFSVAHRPHASVVGITKFLPSYAGIGVINELNNIDDFLKTVRPPFWGVFGGIRLSDKLPVIQALAGKLTGVIFGSSIAVAVLKKYGFGVGDSVISADSIIKVDDVLALLSLQGIKTIWPADLIVGDIVNYDKVSVVDIDFTKVINKELTPFAICQEGEAIYDVGEKTIKQNQELMQAAGAVFWNGPLGFVEKPNFARGTVELAQAVAKSTASSLIGGGDTVSVVGDLALLKDYTFVSMAGGAMLEYVAYGNLVGLEALKS